MNSPSPQLSDFSLQLLSEAEWGVLGTHSHGHAGFPFSSLVQFAIDDQSRPIFLLSGLAEHTHNLKHDSRASLFVRDSRAGEPQSVGRLTMLGEIHRVLDDEVPAVRDLLLQRHPNAALWSGFGDFHWFRMMPLETYVVAGFGRMGWIRP
jgi:putative heme iron utilization protein